MSGERDRADAFAFVFGLAQHLGRRGDEALAPLGLTTRQWLLLAVLGRAFPDRSPTLSEAAAVYGSSRQNVKAIAVGLQATGWLELRVDPGDRRAVRLQLTDRVQIFEGPDWRHQEARFFADLFAGLDSDEVASLADLLRRWAAALALPSSPSGEGLT